MAESAIYVAETIFIAVCLFVCLFVVVSCPSSVSMIYVSLLARVIIKGNEFMLLKKVMLL